MEFRFETDTDVQDAIEEATADACQVLDSLFPGYDAGGITSNFQGHLKALITDMVKGRAPVVRGHSTTLPTLVADDTFFGNPNQDGDAFLIVKLDDPVWEKDEAKDRYLPKRYMIALDPVSATFKPLSACGDAWTSFEAAAADAVKHIRKLGLTMEQAREQEFSIRAVKHADGLGYEVASGSMKVMAA